MDFPARAERLADEVLFPSAIRVDVAGRIPASHLDRLAEEGFYGVAEEENFPQIVEALATGCLATTFVWLQHHGAVRAVASHNHPSVRAQWLEALRSGRRRAGVAIGALRPGPALLRATEVAGGYRLDGYAPWVTGWGMIDVLHLAARTEDDTVVWALVDTVGLRVEPLELVAVQASRTVHIGFDGYFVPAGRVLDTHPFEGWAERDAAGLRTNGSLSLGVAARCCQLLGPGPLDAELAATRSLLDSAGVAELPVARAAASELAMRAAATLVASAGARSVLTSEHGQRLAREALFLLVFGSRPAIKAALVPRLRGDAS